MKRTVAGTTPVASASPRRNVAAASGNLSSSIKQWGRELGFQAVGIADADLSAAESRLLEWLGRGWHGEMEYMARHGSLRARPAELKPGTLRVISCRMDYLNDGGKELPSPSGFAFIARYARGRDYHKVLRDRLQKLCDRVAAEIGEFGYRVFTDSAPVMEVELAARAGIGWRGKHTLLLNRDAGSWFFLGEIYCDIPLRVDDPEKNYCGTCERCIEVCPTQAIRGPYQLDARRCISYLTIEHKSAIPEELRPLIGNRVYGCDDCQLVCPWNRFAKLSVEKDFQPRNGLDHATLVELFNWTEAEFDERLRGSPIRRIGYERWLRNLAVGLGNAPSSPQVLNALSSRKDHPSALVREHVRWALSRHASLAA
ncbi:MAG TPA: tRNA epoxyqueuosine(34) reductase QueG [Burkholderiales bacterium]|nr:tRNA epoxyqueuosine(34) reductase QueG [Burkholderiales bacterium]